MEAPSLGSALEAGALVTSVVIVVEGASVVGTSGAPFVGGPAGFLVLVLVGIPSVVFTSEEAIAGIAETDSREGRMRNGDYHPELSQQSMRIYINKCFHLCILHIGVLRLYDNRHTFHHVYTRCPNPHCKTK